MRSAHLLLLLSLLSAQTFAQDPVYVRQLIDSLCAPRYHGRGYVSNGDNKAGDFLIKQCRDKKLRPVQGKYEQQFTLGVNTFPSEMMLSLNGENLKAGESYFPNPTSLGGKGVFQAKYVSNKLASNTAKLQKQLGKSKFKDQFVILDADAPGDANAKLVSSLDGNPLKAAGYVVLTESKLTWSVGRRLAATPILTVQKNIAPKKIKTVTIEIGQEWLPEHESKNIMALVPGTSDSLVVFTAHYDHLGRMGAETFIAGASDNASGTAMLLDLADYYIQHPPKYTTLFIWFAGEEAGLVGSKYFVEHSPIDLTEIKFLLNLDLMADAKDGVTLVNGKIFETEFKSFMDINAEHNLLTNIKSRGAAANSDHYPFYEKGVPCFFIYTMGEYKHYHDIYDVPENIPLTNYNQVFELITRFVDGI